MGENFFGKLKPWWHASGLETPPDAEAATPEPEAPPAVPEAAPADPTPTPPPSGSAQ